MVLFNFFLGFGRRKTTPALSDEERISKARALESARNYIEAAIQTLGELISQGNTLSDRDK